LKGEHPNEAGTRQSAKAACRSLRYGTVLCRKGVGSELSRHFNQIRDGVGFHLFHYSSTVRLYSDLTDTEFIADLPVQQA